MHTVAITILSMYIGDFIDSLFNNILLPLLNKCTNGEKTIKEICINIFGIKLKMGETLLPLLKMISVYFVSYLFVTKILIN